MGRYALTDSELHDMREALICRMRHRVRNRDDLESLADEALATSIARFDPARRPGLDMGAMVMHLASLRLRSLLRPQYNWRQRYWACEEIEQMGRHSKEDGVGEVDAQDILDHFEGRDLAIVEMRLAGMKGPAIGRALGLSKQWVWVCMTRIRAKIAELMPEAVAAWTGNKTGN